MKGFFAISIVLVLLSLGVAAYGLGPFPYWQWSDVQRTGSLTSLGSEVGFSALFTSNDLFVGGELQLHSLGLVSEISHDNGVTWEQTDTSPGIEWIFNPCYIGSNASFRHEFLVVRCVGPVLQGCYMFHLNTAVNDSFPLCIDCFSVDVANDIYVPEPSSLAFILCGIAFSSIGFLRFRR